MAGFNLVSDLGSGRRSPQATVYNTDRATLPHSLSRLVPPAVPPTQLAPSLSTFLDSFDADYHRYVSLLVLVAEIEAEMEDVQQEAPRSAPGGAARIAARAAALVSEIQQLAPYYDEHVRRDLQVRRAGWWDGGLPDCRRSMTLVVVAVVVASSVPRSSLA